MLQNATVVIYYFHVVFEMVTQQNDLRELLRILERRLGLVDERAKACCGITLAQCHALVEIGRAGALSLNELATLLGLDKSTTSRTVDHLVRQGQVIRQTDTRSRRSVVIRLTGDGQDLFHTIEDGMDQYFRKLQAVIPEARQAEVLDSLRLLVSSISQLDSDADCACPS